MGEVGIQSVGHENGKAGRLGFVTNWTGQGLSPILIYRLDYGFVIGTVQSIANCQENTNNISSVLKALILSQYTERIVFEECSYHQAI